MVITHEPWTPCNCGQHRMYPIPETDDADVWHDCFGDDDGYVSPGDDSIAAARADVTDSNHRQLDDDDHCDLMMNDGRPPVDDERLWPQQLCHSDCILYS